MIPEEKHIRAFLIVDWKSGDITLLKRRPEIPTGAKIALELDITLQIPKPAVQKVEQTIALNEPTVAKIVLQEL